MRCPRCGSSEVLKADSLEQKLLKSSSLKNVQCAKCYTSYNALTGQENTSAIAYKSIIWLIIGIIAVIVILSLFSK